MSSSSPLSIRRALISVSDKTGLLPLAKCLQEQNVEILSTGGTAAYLQGHDIAVRDIADYTQFPEMMGGRVKTLHPKIFGGILARRDRDDHLSAMQDHDILPIDMVVVNLYPFRETVAAEGVSREEAIEQIDIGGPSLIRAAAKNYASVAVVTDPRQYEAVIDEISNAGGVTAARRAELAAAVFEHTAAYDTAIATYLRDGAAIELLPDTLTLQWTKHSPLRYGENPHQEASAYRAGHYHGPSIVYGQQLHGRELSYNNILDADAAMNIVRCFGNAAAVVIKHNNPCGAAWAHRLSYATRKALDGDPLSAFGGILGFNREVDAETAQILCAPGLFIEAMVAPSFAPEAVELLTTKPKWRENVRLIAVGPMEPGATERHYRLISGGLLVQTADNQPPAPLQWQTVTDTQIDDALWEDIAFGWEMVRHVKSNAILLAKDAAVVGVGAGQMSRVDSVEIAIEKAGDRAAGSVLASDAFFPFPDSIEIAAAAGVIAIIQPGGSKKDAAVIEACNKYRIPMIFTGKRHFLH